MSQVLTNDNADNWIKSDDFMLFDCSWWKSILTLSLYIWSFIVVIFRRILLLLLSLSNYFNSDPSLLWIRIIDKIRDFEASY